MVLSIAGAVYNATAGEAMQEQQLEEIREQQGEEAAQQYEQMMESLSVLSSPLLSIIGIAVSIFIIFGAMKMKKLESKGMAMAAAIVAMIPCVSPCCLLGLPLGIWALIVMNKDEVSSQFS